MRLSQCFAPTTKHAPAALSASDTILVRAGYMRPVGAHGLVALPLAARVLEKLRARVHHELSALGVLEVGRPAVVSAEIHRGHPFGEGAVRSTDERRASHVLSPSHVTVAAELARHELRGFRDLPRVLSSSGPRLTRAGGLRERTTIEVCGFHAHAAEATHALREVGDAVVRVLAWAHLPARAHTGPGGSFSVHVASPAGDALLVCAACGHATLAAEAFTTSRDRVASPVATPQKVHTPNARSITDVAAYLAIDPRRLLKSLLYRANDVVVMVVVRGDHDVNELRVAEVLGASEVTLADADEVHRETGAPLGFAGPLGFRGRVLVDTFAARVVDAVVGANEVDYHVRDVSYGRDFQGEIVDVRRAAEGAACPACEGGALVAERGYVLGRGRALDPHVTEGWGVTHIDASQKKSATYLTEATIDVSALFAAIVDATSTPEGLAWPGVLAPFDVHLVSLGAEPEVIAAAGALYAALVAKGVAVVWDDRDDKPGSKLKDAELRGMPARIAVGKRSLATGSVELWQRAAGETKLVPLADVAAAFEGKG